MLNINKPYGKTSHDIVSQIRKILKMKKIGHAGTLDPAATGVLPICTGKTTRLIQYLPADKQYIAEITLGITTTSYDADGDITSSQEVCFDKILFQEALKDFSGDIVQQVPLASATHYKGKKLYKYAHKGIKIEDLPTKKVTIYNIKLLETLDSKDNNPTVKLIIDCGSGTYIRSIANDIGIKLGCGAYLSNLIRTQSSGMNIEDSLTLDELSEAYQENKLNEVFLNPADFIDWPKLEIAFGQIERIIKGQFFKIKNDIYDDNQNLFLIDKDKQIVATGIYDKTRQIIQPKILFIDQ